MNKPKVGMLEWVVWKDAFGSSEREHEDSAESMSPAVMTNLGWVWKENDEVLKLVNGFGSTGEVDVLTILKANIISREPVTKRRGPCQN